MGESQDKDLIKLITSRQAKLESDRGLFDERMQDIADYVAPQREDIKGNLAKGSPKGTKIYDGTAQGAAVLATDGIHGYHVSPAFPWFKYQMNRKEVNKIPEIKEWLQDIEFVMYMALNRSNFYSEMWNYIYDGFTIGTAPIYAEEDIAEGRIMFESIHPGEVYVSENKYGEVDLLHRKRKLSARKIIQMFGEGGLPTAIRQASQNAPFTEFEVIHAVFPREEWDDRKMDGKNKRYASVWYLKTGNHICRVSGFDSFPFHVWRYMKSGKEEYGISPAMLAMSDIKGINLMSKTLLGAAQMSIDLPLNVPSEMQGKVQWKPRGFNYYDDPNRIIRPATTGIQYPVGVDREQAKQKAIKERFHVDTFLMLSQLEGRGQRTAYEVSEMMAEKAAILGAELGPLNTQLDLILDRVYDIEKEAGRMPEPPDILFEMAAQDPHLRFDPIYMGPLAQAQRERFAKDGIRKFFMDIAPIVQLKPDILDNYDLDEASRILGDINSIPQEMIIDKEQVQTIRQGRVAALQQEQTKQDMLDMSQGMKTVASADKDAGGALTQSIMQAAGGAGA